MSIPYEQYQEVLDDAGRYLAEVRRLEADNARLREALKLARRAIGDHHAPNDCYATGPLTGDDYRDLVECPACAFLAALEAKP